MGNYHSSYFAKKVTENKRNCEKLFEIQKNIYIRTVVISRIETLIRLETNHHLLKETLCPINKEIEQYLTKLTNFLKKNICPQIGFCGNVEELQILTSLCEVIYNSTCGSIKKSLLLGFYIDTYVCMFNFSLSTVKSILPKLENANSMRKVQQVLDQNLRLELENFIVLEPQTKSSQIKLFQLIQNLKSQVTRRFHISFNNQMKTVNFKEIFQSYFIPNCSQNNTVSLKETQVTEEIYRRNLSFSIIQCLIKNHKKGKIIRSQLEKMKLSKTN